VLAVAVGGGRSAFRREGDQRVRPRRLDAGKPAAERARCHGALHALGKGIVAAGIEDDEPQLLGRLDRLQNAIQRNRLVIGVGVALQHGVDRNEVVGPVHLEAVAGIIDHGEIGIARLLGELAQRTPHFGVFEIAAGFDDVEGGLFEHVGDGGGIVGRIGKRNDVLIVGIADHERDALVRQRGPAGKANGQGGNDQGGKPAHRVFSEFRSRNHTICRHHSKARAGHL